MNGVRIDSSKRGLGLACFGLAWLGVAWLFALTYMSGPPRLVT